MNQGIGLVWHRCSRGSGDFYNSLYFCFWVLELVFGNESTRGHKYAQVRIFSDAQGPTAHCVCCEQSREGSSFLLIGSSVPAVSEPLGISSQPSTPPPPPCPAQLHFTTAVNVPRWTCCRTLPFREGTENSHKWQKGNKSELTNNKPSEALRLFVFFYQQLI